MKKKEKEKKKCFCNFQLQEATKFFSYFSLQLVRMKNSKKACPRFLITFLLFEILAYITFLFPLKSVLNMKNSSWHKNRTFFEESSRARFSSAVISSNVHGFLKELCQRFFDIELEHCTLTEIPLKDLHFFIGTETLIHLQDLMTVIFVECLIF